jgi:hypothetical protein
MEDYAMSSVKLEPLTVVGIEGLLGTAALFLVLMPIVQARSARGQRWPGCDCATEAEGCCLR